MTDYYRARLAELWNRAPTPIHVAALCYSLPCIAAIIVSVAFLRSGKYETGEYLVLCSGLAPFVALSLFLIVGIYRRLAVARALGLCIPPVFVAFGIALFIALEVNPSLFEVSIVRNSACLLMPYGALTLEATFSLMSPKAKHFFIGEHPTDGGSSLKDSRE